MDAIILSGGQALRMGGVTKAFLRLGAETFLERILRTLAPLVDSIILATNAPELYANVTGVRVVADNREGRGPLMGLYAGLSASTSELAFVTTADTPLLQASLVRYLLDNAIDCDALVPCWEKGWNRFARYTPGDAFRQSSECSTGDAWFRSIPPFASGSCLSQSSAASTRTARRFST